ncbi:Metallo-hydrolase/oxidoreductase, partial [Hysterangium stoloniferum]
GTCSGGGPTLQRACSSLSLNLESTSWLVDCAEGTQSQLLRVSTPKINKISKIFITHLHVDHCCGIVPFMSSAMTSASNPENALLDNRLHLEIYGPSGIRNLIRMNLRLTQTLLKGKYAAHELLFENDRPMTCDKYELHQNEVPGKDIRIDADGFWRNFETSQGFKIDAAPIVHRVPCLGYVFTESPEFRITQDYIARIDAIPQSLLPRPALQPRYLLNTLLDDNYPQSVRLKDGSVIEPPPRDIPGRKVVILGDTSDPSAIVPLAQNASLLVHEATNAWMPPHLEKWHRGVKTPEEVREKAISRGHSTADMAGAFANLIGAQRLFLNHFSVKFPDPGPHYRTSGSSWAKVMREIEDQASLTWKMGQAVAASDLLVVDISAPEVWPRYCQLQRER